MTDTTTIVIAAGTIGLAVIIVYVLFGGGKKDDKKEKKKVVSKKSTNNSSSSSSSSSSGKSKITESVFLNRKRQTVPLIEKVELTHDTRLFKFGLSSEDSALGLPTGKHIHLFCPNPEQSEDGMWNGREDKETGQAEIRRSYTPTSSDDDKGHFDLVIKVYEGGVIDRFPDGGKMSQYLNSLNVGDTMDIRGPFGLIQYQGNGEFHVSRKPKHTKHVGMISGGTGITPMLQVIVAALKDKDDTTTFSLLFANQREEDILVRDMLEEYSSKYPDRFKLWYTLDHPPEDWTYSKGFVNEDMIASHLPAPSEDTIILMCGPPPMIKFACKPNLEKLGYDMDSCYEF